MSSRRRYFVLKSNLQEYVMHETNDDVVREDALEVVPLADHLAAVEAVRRAYVKAIPTTWLDPLLSGDPDQRALGEYPYGCPDIERLLKAIAKRIEARDDAARAARGDE